jgi:transcriptional regulator with XRE-family HTH domain
MNLQELARRVKRLRGRKGAPGYLSQGQLADRLETAASRVSEWESRKGKPTAAALFRLGNLAANIEDTIWFWTEAGLDPIEVVKAARKIGLDLEGSETVPVPRFQYTSETIREAGTLLPLPKKKLPHPEKTICVAFDPTEIAARYAPTGEHVVDTWCRDLRDISLILERILFIGCFPPGKSDRLGLRGFHVGRLRLDELIPTRVHGQIARDQRPLGYEISLQLLVLPGFSESIELGSWSHPSIKQYLGFEETTATPEQKAALDVALDETQEIGLRTLQLYDWVQVLGEVIGHFEGPAK